ncbi:BadF/BadG/BcrA/BcrD ATPase family protein [Streptomyces sp. NPDC026206]|uniref:N-acetylglucosamine kinase n=1 Tax=Streptomyces sp. NPDC026206 TaxID=3157089 RepID=UPI0033CAB617
MDAGNSKTDVAVVGSDGTVYGTARGGGFQPQAVGVEPAVDVLQSLAAEAEAEALGELRPPLRIGHVSACLANADFPVEEERLSAELSRRNRAAAVSPTVEVVNDTFALLRAGLPDEGEPAGVAVVCGAGINCSGLAPGGRTARFAAVGRISGDWGGGGHLAEEALWWAARAEDGRGGPTALARELPAHFGLRTMLELIEALHLGRIERQRRHELTPVLFAVAAAGDAVARAIVERQADEVVGMAAAALARLDLLDADVPVVLGGGVLAARHPLLHERVVELLAVRAPRAVPCVVTAPPVLGAALLAFDRAGAAPAAYARLRAHYARA